MLQALHFKKYSTASDVWSYGAVMYEIWSLGHKPFEGCTNQEVSLAWQCMFVAHQGKHDVFDMQTIKEIDQGIRLHPPPGCPVMIYELMMQCWWVGSNQLGVDSILIWKQSNLNLQFRHPETAYRPTFTQLLQALSSTITKLLSWSEEDTRVHPQAAVLGSPLEAGKDLYPELQGTYFHVQE